MKRSGMIYGVLFFILCIILFTTGCERDFQIFLSKPFLPPDLSHPFGTDRLGRDLFSLSLLGILNSLFIGSIASTVSLVVGTFIGTLSGLNKRFLDPLIMRIVEIFQAFPGFLLAIAFSAFLGPSVFNVIMAISFFAWVGFARISRGIVLRVRELDYYHWTRVEGAGILRVLVFHLLPEVASAVKVQFLLVLSGSMLTEASLSFLGVGPPGMVSIGKIIAEGIEFILLQPGAVVLPGALFFAVLAVINLSGSATKLNVN